MDSLINSAKKEVQIGEHIVHVTMNMLNDKKLLISAINHLEKAVEYIMVHELRNSRKPVPINKNLLKSMFAQVYAGPGHIIKIIEKISEMADSKKHEQICYIKDNNIVIITNNYETKVISEEEIKKIIVQLKEYLRERK